MTNLILDFFSQIFEKIPKIDEKNQIIGKTSRIKSFILRQPIRAVNAFILNQKDELLLQKRSPWISHPLKWADCTGASTFNLSQEESALKEVKEELFHNHPFPDIKLTKIAEFKYSSHWQKSFNTLFTIKFDGPFYPSKLEVNKVKFMPISTIKTELANQKISKQYSRAFKAAFRAFLEKKSK